MRIRYFLTHLDVIRASIRATTFNRALIAYFAILLLIVSVMTLRGVLQEGGNLLLALITLLFQVAIIALLTIAGQAVFITISLFFFSKGKGILGEHELEITESGLIERTKFNESLHKWLGVTALRESSQFYFIRVNEAGGAAHVVPKKNRMIEGDLKTFVEELRRKISI